jgi:hypothetical protein
MEFLKVLTWFLSLVMNQVLEVASWWWELCTLTHRCILIPGRVGSLAAVLVQEDVCAYTSTDFFA